MVAPALLCALSNEVVAEYSASVQPAPADASGPPDCATCVVVPDADWLLLAAWPTVETPVEAHPAAVTTASAGSTMNRNHFLPRPTRVPISTPR